ncbi:MAG: hypothetical protein ACJASX_003779 [Limisphaerales bacterium]|jgi:hypothetical protein
MDTLASPTADLTGTDDYPGWEKHNPAAARHQRI